MNDLRIAGGLLGISSVLLLWCGVVISNPISVLLGTVGLLATAVLFLYGRIPEKHRVRVIWAVGAIPAVLMVVFGALTGSGVMLLLGFPILVGVAIGLLVPANAQISGPPGWLIHVFGIGMIVVLTLLPTTELRVGAFLIATTVGSPYFLQLALRARRS